VSGCGLNEVLNPNLAEGLRKITRILAQNSQLPGRTSKRALPEQKATALLQEQPVPLPITFL
jgi:hypothetical protein